MKVTQRQYGIVYQQDTYKNMWWGVLMYQQHRSRSHVEIVTMNQAYHEQHIFDHLNESRTQAIYHIGESRIYDGQREISMRHRIPPLRVLCSISPNFVRGFVSSPKTYKIHVMFRFTLFLQRLLVQHLILA